MNVCVFCGSRPGAVPAHLELAADLGRSLAAAGHRLVYGGASVGLMGALADACLQAGGEVVGVIPRVVVDREVAHQGLSEQVVVDSLAERKTVMVARCDAFVSIPGGLGTLDELFEVWTMAYLGLHDHPVLLLDPGDYYGPLLTFLDRAVEHAFVEQGTLDQLIVERTTEALLNRLAGDRKTPVRP